jgi:Activator of Hsp90 ATPase homolog 1-like protein
VLCTAVLPSPVPVNEHGGGFTRGRCSLVSSKRVFKARPYYSRHLGCPERVMELVPGKRVKWQCVDGAPEWIGTELTFDLKQEADSTVVLFAQRGWKEQVDFMHYCSTKWATYLLSLKSLCETSKGTPYPDDVDIG